jgi:hypothetical protein
VRTDGRAAVGRVAVLAALGLLGLPAAARGQEIVALWLFDEQRGLYPSSVINDASGEPDLPMVLGLGGEIVEGRFGNALEIRAEPRPVELIPTGDPDSSSTEGAIFFGLAQALTPPGRTVAPLSWRNAHYPALMTSGENHLRKEVGFGNPTGTGLNLGDFDWTVELWFQPTGPADAEGVVFELGAGPRGENDLVTRLSLDAGGQTFTLVNQPSGTRLRIPTAIAAPVSPVGAWQHLAFVYAADEGRLRHYVDGALQPLPEQVRLEALEPGEEAYFVLGSDGGWERPLAGRIDEMRFSRGEVYQDAFEPPGSFAPPHDPPVLAQGPPLLFAPGVAHDVVPLGGRKHLFIDDALIAEMERVTFTPNPPRKAEIVIADIQGAFRKHLSVIEDDGGGVRIYNGVEDDRLEVHVAEDGVDFEDPDLGVEYRGSKNITVLEPTATGSVFIDPNAAPERRWVFVSGFHDRGTYVYTSPDGWRFERHPTAVVPLHVGSQANVFWDDQRGTYIGYHRSDCRRFPSGESRREWVMTEVRDLVAPWPFSPTPRDQIESTLEFKDLRDPQPWFLDNGPLTPGGFCIEYPTAFAPVDSLDPLATDVYVPKAMKYPWAEDTYLAFPTMYFHYWEDGPKARQALGVPERGLGSGPIETQVEVSRDAVHWKRYPRPVYVGIGDHGGYDVVQAYIAHGMVRRGHEIWQYYFGTEEYHSTLQESDPRSGVFRLVQRLDGFVSADTPYDTTGVLVTKPLRFEGDRLVLNIDTNATGYAQVGFLDDDGRPIPGFSVDESVYINGDFIAKEVEWLGKGTDVSELEGQTIRIVFRMRGSKLYAMQFVRRESGS